MKRALLSLFFFFLLASMPLKADSSRDLKVTVRGPFLVIQEIGFFSPAKITALRRTSISAVRVEDENLLIRTSDSELVQEEVDKTKIRRLGPKTYVFNLKDEDKALKYFEVVLSLLPE